MADVRDLEEQQAVAKIRDLAADQVAMLCTFPTGAAMESRPMATQGIDDDGTMWFFSPRGSTKNRHLATNPSMQVIYADPSRSRYLALAGTATVLRDQAKIDQLWTPIARTWFHDGKDDPALTLIRFTPTAGHYWDTKTSRMVQMAKIAVGAVLGRTTDDAVEGELDP